MTQKTNIGELAEGIVEHVRQRKLTKLLQHEMVKQAAAKSSIFEPTSELSGAMMKIAALLRAQATDITVNDLQNFVTEVQGAR